MGFFVFVFVCLFVFFEDKICTDSHSKQLLNVTMCVRIGIDHCTIAVQKSISKQSLKCNPIRRRSQCPQAPDGFLFLFFL